MLRKGGMLRQARVRILGHLNYYAITDNVRQCGRYAYYDSGCDTLSSRESRSLGGDSTFALTAV